MDVPKKNLVPSISTTPHFLQQLHSKIVLGGGDLGNIQIIPDRSVKGEDVTISLSLNNYERLKEAIRRDSGVS